MSTDARQEERESRDSVRYAAEEDGACAKAFTNFRGPDNFSKRGSGLALSAFIAGWNASRTRARAAALEEAARSADEVAGDYLHQSMPQYAEVAQEVAAAIRERIHQES